MVEERPFNIEAELAQFSAALVKEYLKAASLVGKRLLGDDLEAWAQEGLSIARHGPRSWEAALEYFKASPRVLEVLEFPYVIPWARWGLKLAAESPALASAYFRASPAVVNYLLPHRLGDWAIMVRGLYKGTWRSSTLCCGCFEASPGLLRYLTLDETERFLLFLDFLAQRSPDLAQECLQASPEVFSGIDRQDRKRFLALAQLIAQTQWGDARAYFKAGPKVLSRIERGERDRFLSLADRIAHLSSRLTLPFILDGSRALGQVDMALHPRVLRLSGELLEASCQSSLEFLKSCPTVLSRIRFAELERWFQEGAQLLEEGEEAAIAYFRLESSRSEKVLAKLSAGVELGTVREVLRMYCKALTGKNVQILPAQNLTEKGIGWVSQEKASTEGSAVFLPSFVERFGGKEDNFAWFKVVATHQAAHLEFGSFDFVFQKPGKVFPSLRFTRPLPLGLAPLADLERFFDLFPDRKLASDLFTVVEDARVDFGVKQEYQGLRPLYERMQSDAVTQRPPLPTLPLREAFLEVLVRLSLEDSQPMPIPPEVRPYLKEGARTLRQVQSLEAVVEDSAEAVLRLYDLVSRLPNQKRPEEDWKKDDLGSRDRQARDGMPLSLGEGGPQEGDPGSPGAGSEEVPYSSPQEVEFRGVFKPELVQLLMKLREGKTSQPAKPIPGLSPEALKELLEKSAEIEMSQVQQGDLKTSTGLFISNLLKEAGQQKPPSPYWDPSMERMSPNQKDAGPLEKDEPYSFLYDEWDFRANDYKPRWCRVRQRVMEEGSQDFFERTLQKHRGLVAQIRKQFELLNLDVFRKIKKLPDGEEYELDAVVEAIAEKKAGQSPSEKLYWRRKKLERDVAVVFLLDMSASTAEAVEDAKRGLADWDYTDDPRWYLSWLRAQRAEEGRRSYRRIIDVEKESTVLLIWALETAGDTYGIYGFSGYGRDNVELYVIKDINEGFSDTVKRRIDKIAPMHATRMGPAIRHGIFELENRDARTKILFLISDGRPQDHGYSRDGMEKEYAIHDTKMALTEAKRKRIVPFCLTVDRAGHDYLKTMCDDLGYEVVRDIESLPSRLPALYRRLAFRR